jgi:hypothetical protein
MLVTGQCALLEVRIESCGVKKTNQKNLSPEQADGRMKIENSEKKIGIEIPAARGQSTSSKLTREMRVKSRCTIEEPRAKNGREDRASAAELTA